MLTVAKIMHRSTTTVVLLKRKISLHHISRSNTFLIKTFDFPLCLRSRSRPFGFAHACQSNEQANRKVDSQEIINAVVRSEKEVKRWMKQPVIDVHEDEIRCMLKKVGKRCTEKRIVVCQSNIRLLQKLGCPLDQVKKFGDIIRLTETEILYEVDRLKNIGFDVVYPELIFIAYNTESNPELKCKTNDWLCKMFGFEQKIEFLQALMKFTEADLKLTSSHLHFYRTSASVLSRLIQKIHVLLDSGYTMEEIKKCLRVLDFSVETLQKRINAYKKLAPLVKIPLTYLVKRPIDKTLPQDVKINQKDSWKRVKTEKYDPYKKCKNNYEIVGKILKVDVCYLTELKFLEKMRREILINKLKLLLDCGIPGSDILNHKSVLHHSIATVEKTIEKIKKLGFEKISCHHIIDLIPNKRFPYFVKRVKCESDLARLLQVSLYDIQLLDLQNLWQTDTIQIQINFEILMKHGFSVENIKACPLLLGHRKNILEIYLATLFEHDEELKLFPDITENKDKILNALQYFIEKEHYFCGVVT